MPPARLQAPAPPRERVFNGEVFELWTGEYGPKATGPLPVPVVLRGTPFGKGQFDHDSVPGVVLAWTEVQV